jgi:hypothetical protein
MTWFFALFVSAALAGPAEITFSDPRISAIDLDCGSGVERFLPSGGKVTLKEIPKHCKVSVVLLAGTIDGAGRFLCGLDSCKMEEIMHKPVSNGPGKVNIIVQPGTDATDIEVKCPGGYRERSAIEENTGLFTGVPSEECELLFKGGFPGKFRPLTVGTWQCSQVGAVAVCQKKN